MRQHNAVYTIHWSPIMDGDKYVIQQKVPSMSGIYQLFFADKYKKLILYDMDIAWYGGLRANLRALTDPEVGTKDKTTRRILQNEKIYFRYTLSESYKDLSDVLSLLAEMEFENPDDFTPSGRYDDMLLYEESPNKITTV